MKITDVRRERGGSSASTPRSAPSGRYRGWRFSPPRWPCAWPLRNPGKGFATFVVREASFFSQLPSRIRREVFSRIALLPDARQGVWPPPMVALPEVAPQRAQFFQFPGGLHAFGNHGELQRVRDSACARLIIDETTAEPSGFSSTPAISVRSILRMLAGIFVR